MVSAESGADPGADPGADAAVRAIAFYLPQFHAIPENDRWWGEGFTEWTNVRRAEPQFPGHGQPKSPGALGWYDLTSPGVAAAQAELAKAHGLAGFCYYFYWFNGHRLLERPLEAMVASGSPDFPFCVCWANENWTRRWDGLDSEVLMAQHYSLEDSERLFDEFLRLFRDRRYLRVDGRPLLLVYKPVLIPELARTVERWRAQAARSGERAPYLVACETTDSRQPLDAGFDATVEFPPHRHRAVWMNAQIAGLDPGFRGIVTSYRAQVIQSLTRRTGGARRLRCVFPSWDNTARRGRDATVFAGSSPELFGHWVEAMVRDTRRRLSGDERLLFVNAWNEWAEGCCLEPDARYGTRYLEALRDGLDAGGAAPLASWERPRWADVESDLAGALARGELRVTRNPRGAAKTKDGVSVVMPIYNHERFLARTLDSIAAQTLAPSELVAIDDGSSDAGADLVEAWARDAPFPVVVARQPNRGAHTAINRGLALAAGEVVALLNSDDLYDPRRLETMLAALDDGHALAFSAVEFVDDDARPVRTGASEENAACAARLAAGESLIEVLIAHNVAVSSGNLVFRRSLLDATGGFGGFEITHDWDFLLAATRHTGVAFVPARLYRYRVHGGNTLADARLAVHVESEHVIGAFLEGVDTHPRLDARARARLAAIVESMGLSRLWPH